MTSSDDRRSRVPLGTFRSSVPPPGPSRPAANAQPAEAEAPPAPSTAAAPHSKAPPPIPEAARSHRPPADRATYTSTLVGHPTTGATSVAPPAGPVLAPPPWRGAQAYESGEEPQPRISNTPLSAPVSTLLGIVDGPVPHPDARRVPNTHITASAVPAVTPPDATESAAIGDAIQQLLDAQASVSMEVEEPAQELGVDDVIESFSDPDSQSAPVVSQPPPTPVGSERPAEQPLAKIALARVALRSAPVPASTAAPSSRWSVPPAPVSRMPAPEPVPDRELASYSFVEQEPEPAEASYEAASAAGAAPSELSHTLDADDATSVAPAEVARRASRPVSDANYRHGALAAAALALVLVGGWFATRGGFVRPPRAKPAAAVGVARPTPAEPSATARKPAVPAEAEPPAIELAPSAPAEAPAVEAPVAEAPAEEAEPAQPSASVAAGARQAPAPKPAPRTTSRANDGSEGQAAPEPARSSPVVSAEPAAEPPSQEPSGSPVLRLTPHGQPPAPEGELPETPSRENVQAALDAVRAQVVACTMGQHGVAEVDLTVGSNGLVTHAVVAGDFAGTPAGSCIARVVRGARFAAFSKPRFRVIYPFSL